MDEFSRANNFVNDIKRLVGRDGCVRFLNLMKDIRREGIDSLDKRETAKKVYDLFGDHEDLMRKLFEYLPIQDAMDALIVEKRGKHDPVKVDLNCNDVKGEPSENEPGQEAREIDDPCSDQSEVQNSILQKAIGVFRKLIDIVETILNNKEGNSSEIGAEVHRLVDEIRLETEKYFSEDSSANKDFGAISSDVVNAVEEVVQIVEKEFPNTNSKASSELKVVEKEFPNTNSKASSEVKVVEKEFPNTNSQASSELKVVEKDIKRAKVHRVVEKIRHKTEKGFFKNSCAKKDISTISSDIVEAVEEVVQIVEKGYPGTMLLEKCNIKASSELKVVEDNIQKGFS